MSTHTITAELYGDGDKWYISLRAIDRPTTIHEFETEEEARAALLRGLDKARMLESEGVVTKIETIGSVPA